MLESGYGWPNTEHSIMKYPLIQRIGLLLHPLWGSNHHFGRDISQFTRLGTTWIHNNFYFQFHKGDHKQLKPSTTVYELALTYNLDLSLFERMVNNNIPLKTLNTQHRMRPEVSKYIKHIYDDLRDNPNVQNRGGITGKKETGLFSTIEAINWYQF